MPSSSEGTAVMGELEQEGVDERLLHPGRPKTVLPRGACDCHAHLFELPSDVPAPANPRAKHRLAPFSAYRAMLARVGFSRAVLVQPSAYGADHTALVNALALSPDTMRGIAVKASSVSDSELAALHLAGVRGLRFNQLVGPGSNIDITHLPQLAGRMRDLGWHAQIYANCDFLAEALPAMLSADVPIVIDHMARVGPEPRAITDSAFRYVRDVLREGRIWLKLTTYRNSREPGGYSDMRPFHDAFVAANSDRLLWGSDWPYLSTLDASPPDTGALIDLVGDWIQEKDIRRKVFSANPASLYGFQDVSGV
jgi:2-pyrone-4,6-dicarboxylate lactonase